MSHETPILKVNFCHHHWELICRNKWQAGISKKPYHRKYQLWHTMRNMAPKLSWYFYLLQRSLLITISKFGLLTVRWLSATSKHISLTDQVCGRQIRISINETYDQRSSPNVSFDWSNNSNSVLTQWGARLVNIIKHLPQILFLLGDHH